MATIAYEQVEKSAFHEIIKWPGIGVGDVGAPYVRPGQTEKTVQWVKGSAFGGAVVLKGTLMAAHLEAGTAVWVTLTDPQGNALSKDATDGETIQENMYAYRPEGATGAEGVDVYLLVV